MNKDLSVIIPVYNEVENLKVLHENLKSALGELNLQYEVIYVDDGSNDGGFEVLQEIKDECTKLIKFRKNFGQTAAMQAGIDYSCGNIIIMMDADLQNNPEDISKLLDKYNEGYDLVSGWRKKRQDNSLRTIPSKIANSIISKITKVDLHDTGCSLKAYNGEILRKINLFADHHRFIPAIFSQYSDKITEIEVNHQPRLYGKSKYNISRTIRVIIDLVAISYRQKYKNCPMYFWGKIALIMFLFAFLLLISCLINLFQIPAFDLYNCILLELFTAFFISGFVFFGVGTILESNLEFALKSGKTKNYDIEKFYE